MIPQCFDQRRHVVNMLLFDTKAERTDFTHMGWLLLQRIMVSHASVSKRRHLFVAFLEMFQKLEKPAY